MSVDRFIRKLELFAELDREETDLIRSAIESSVTFEPADDILLSGEPTRFVHILVDGWAGRYADLPSGERQITACLLPGDLCNRHVAVMRQTDHSVGALSPCHVALVREDRFETLVTGHAGIGRAFRLCAAVDEAIAREWLVSLGRRTAVQRVAHLICEMHARLEAIGLSDGNGFELPLKQSHLADMMGLSVVHINRSLRKLQDDGLIRYHSGRMSILDRAALCVLADFDPHYLRRAIRAAAWPSLP